MGRDCSACANMGKSKCRTMAVIPNKKWCFMTIEDAIKAERGIIKYLIEYENEEYNMRKTLLTSKTIINKLEEKREQQKKEQ